jgi:hypothetical protein
MSQNDISAESIGSSRYYVDTFLPEIETVWGKTPFNLVDLCYRSALASFKDSSESNIADRQSLLFNFLRGPFSIGKDSDALNVGRKQLPTGSLAPKVLRNICIAYAEDPTRKFSNQTVTNDILTRYYTEARANVELRHAHEMATLTNYVLVRPYFTFNGKCRFQTLLPDCFRVVLSDDPGEPDKLKAVWIAVDRPKKGERKQVFEVWTDELVTAYDADAQPIGQPRPNPYGKIPHVPLQMVASRSTDDAMGGGLFEIVEASLIDNSLKWIGFNNLLFNGFSVWVATNMEWNTNNASLSPGKVITIEDAQAGNDINPLLPPQLDTVSADSHFGEIGEERMNRREEFLREVGLPNFLASRQGGVPPTGIALMIEMLELLDRRKRDLPVLNDFERGLAEMTALVARVDRKESGLPELLPEMSTEFSEPRAAIEPEAERKFDAINVAAGIMPLETFVMKWEGLDHAITEAEAVKRISDRRLLYASVLPVLKIYTEGEIPPVPPPATTANLETEVAATVERGVGDKIAVISIAEKYYAGALTLESAIAILVETYQFTEDAARKQIPPKPEPAPTNGAQAAPQSV